MNSNKKAVKEVKVGTDVVKKMSNKEKKELVTRGEFVEILSQITENVNQMGSYLMADVNTLYKNHVFPFQMRLAVIEDILCEKCLTTQENIKKRAEERYHELEKQAQELKEKEEKEGSDSDRKVTDKPDLKVVK